MDFGNINFRSGNKWRTARNLSHSDFDTKIKGICHQNQLRISKQNDVLEKNFKTSTKYIDNDIKNLSTEFVNQQMKIFMTDFNSMMNKRKSTETANIDQRRVENNRQLEIQRAKSALITNINRKSKSKGKDNCRSDMYRQHSLNPNYLQSISAKSQDGNNKLLETQIYSQRYMFLRRAKSAAMVDEVDEIDKKILEKSGVFISPYLNPGKQLSIDRMLKENCRENQAAIDKLVQAQATSDTRYTNLINALQPMK